MSKLSQSSVTDEFSYNCISKGVLILEAIADLNVRNGSDKEDKKITSTKKICKKRPSVQRRKSKNCNLKFYLKKAQ